MPPAKSSKAAFPDLISVSKAASLLQEPDVLAVDASWHMPDSGRSAKGEYIYSHLPGAVFFDIDTISNRRSGLPHMLPTEKAFAEAVGKLGISNTHRLIIYDSHGLFSAARVWWMFRTFGHKHCAILDGGLPVWKKMGKPLEKSKPKRLPTHYNATFIPRNVASASEICENLALPKKKRKHIIDARSPERFYGWEPEPRPGLRSGHIPDSHHLHYREILDPDTGKVRSKTVLKTLFKQAGISPTDPAITSCGSGVTAAVIGFVLHLLGNTQWQLYDGSWAEWGQYNPEGNNLPVALDISERTGFTLPQLITRDVTFTHLEMAAPPTTKMPSLPRRHKMALMKIDVPTLDFYRYLFVRVGRKWHWTERLVLPDDIVTKLITSKHVEIYALYVNGVPAGFAELDFKTMPRARLAYFGLMPEFIGLGLGHYFLRAAITIAWQRTPDSLWVSTNSNDHPRALALYQKVGFTPKNQFDGKELMFLETE